MTEPGTLPEGFTVDAVDWLPSGARSGLVRVRGHRPPAVSGPLPELILETDGKESRRYVSLPDPRADRDPTAWRGAYVLEARPAAEADRLWLEWPGSRRIALPPLAVPEHQVARSTEPEAPVEEAADHGEVVVDRAVLAERRARRAEAAEQAQARIAREALRAVEVLELRIAELELGEPRSAEPADDGRAEALAEEVRGLRAQLSEREEQLARRPEPEAAPEPEPALAPEPARIAPSDAERRAERLRSALTATVGTVAELRMRLHQHEVDRRTRDVAAAADAVRLAVVERERAGLERELEAAREELARAVADRDEALARVAELEAELETAVPAGSPAEELEELRERLEAAEVAREIAEASALAAVTRRQADAVARATASPSGPSTRGDDPASATPAEDTPPPKVPDALIAAAAEAERAAAGRQPTEESDRVVADLDAAAAALRAGGPEPGPDPEPGAEPAVGSMPPPHVSFDPTPVNIVSAHGEPPGDVARGRSNRDYPPLRGALVKLAHDDPAAAGRILAGLLKAQHAVLAGAPDYDLTIAEVGTFAVSPAGQTTLVSPISAPRGRGQAAFHLQTDALTLAEAIAGVEASLRRRRGPIRVSGKVRAARRLTEDLRKDASLDELVRAGAELDPALVLRALSYAVRPAWTQGQQWVVEVTVGDSPLTVEASHSGGLEVTEGPPAAEPDARLRLTEERFRELVTGELAEPPGEGDERALRRLLALADRARSGAE